MRRMFDAAYPESVVKFGVPLWEAVAGYIGGNTPNVWTKDEWQQLIELSGAQYALPIFTRSNPATHSATEDVQAAINRLNFLGVPKNVCVAWDLETAIAPSYVKSVDDQMQAAGWKVMIYGSKSTLFMNGKPSGGFWVADYTGNPHLYPGSAATQWMNSKPFGGAYDPNLVADTTSLWRVKMSEADVIKAINNHSDELYRMLARGELPSGLKDGRANLTSIQSLATGLTDDEAKILTAINGINKGMTDEQVQEAAATMAATLNASLPAAFVAALKDAL